MIGSAQGGADFAVHLRELDVEQADGRFHCVRQLGRAALEIGFQLRDAASAHDASLGQPAPAAAIPFENFGLLEVRHVVDVEELLAQLRSILDASSMGTRLYLAGPESFIGRAMTIALEFNMNQDEIRAEQIGSTARRVHCIHCRHTAEAVRTNIVRCGGCDRWLLVRDHYSRRHSAYMGVMVDAEAPGELPAVREIYV